MYIYIYDFIYDMYIYMSLFVLILYIDWLSCAFLNGKRVCVCTFF